MHPIKKSKTRALAVVAVFVAGSLLPMASSLAQEELNRIVLRVNDEIMTHYDFEKRKEDELSAILADPNLSPADRQAKVAEVSKEVAQQSFREMLLESYARQNGINMSERDVDDAVRRIQEQQGLSSTRELLDALEKAGLSLEQLRENLRREMLLSSVVRREVTGQIEVTDDEMRAYYRNNPEEFQVPEERQLREVIFLDESGLSDEQLRDAAQKLHAAVSGDADFETEVAAYQDQGLATGVIDLGWVKAEDLGEDLARAAFSVPVGSYSEPTRARGGYHVVHAQEAKEAYVLPFTEVESMIDARERNRRFGPELRKFMARLEATSHIVENLPADAVGFRTLAEDFNPESELDDFRAPVLQGPKAEDAAAEDAATEDAAAEEDADGEEG